MSNMTKMPVRVLILILSVAVPISIAAALAQSAPAGNAQPGKLLSFLGTVQAIDGELLTVKSDTGVTMRVTVEQNARLLRIEPGQKSLQSASSLSFPDLQVGDRVLARGLPSQDGKQLAAVLLVAIKKADIVQKQQQEREDWREHGVGGLVRSINPAAGTVTISTAGRRMLTIETSPSTILRRYAPGSVKFDDAKPAPLTSIKPGDQLRARGVASGGSAGGGSFTAEEIVSGSFRNIAGAVVTVDPTASTLTVTDLATRHPVVIKITPDTQLKKLDRTVAEHIAMRLSSRAPNRPAASPSKASQAGPPPGNRSGESVPDPQQILAAAPSVPLKNFAKGDAVMLVATEDPGRGPITAVTVVGGVEPMLQASTSGSQAMLSSAWNLGAGGGSGNGEGGEETPQAPQ